MLWHQIWGNRNWSVTRELLPASRLTSLQRFRFSLEINPALDEVKQALAGVEKWAKTERAPFSMTYFAMRPVIHKEPKGVVLVISPFNYPIWLTVPLLVEPFVFFCDGDAYLYNRSPVLLRLDAPYFSSPQSRPQR
jgi:Aldehyde dehydrogenase family